MSEHPLAGWERRSQSISPDRLHSILIQANSMNILFVTRSLPFHHVGGMEAVAWDLARALVERGHSVDIVTTEWPTMSPSSAGGETVTINGIRITTIRSKPGRYSRLYWKEVNRIYDGKFSGSVDLVLSVGMGGYGIASRRTRGNAPAVVMQSHGQAWGELMSKLAVPSLMSWIKAPKNLHHLFMDRNLSRFDSIISVGPAVQKILTSYPTRALVGKAELFTIPNGIDDRVFSFSMLSRLLIRRELGLSNADPVLISASRLHPQKGIREALEGFLKAKQRLPTLKYIIAGDGPAATDLRGYVASLGIDGDVRFVGPVSRERLPGYLSAADAFVFTSVRKEGLALGPLEAAATGLPCVLSNHLQVDGLEASSVDPTNAASISKGMLEAIGIGSPDERQSRLPHVYSLAHSAHQYEIAFRRAIAGGA